ncbi:MAG: hypothetical protein K2M69_05600 [Muribaculaceae bacterium]|nr:hypothetical protein [Muribaculaceae bacterium]
MDLNPDSILAVLSSIDTTDLSSHDRALCDLLYVQALDKTDSLAASPFSGVSRIASAFNYFDHKGSDREKMLANFYRGRCCFYSHTYEAAMHHGFFSYNLAKKISDPFWIAKTAESIADICSATFLSDDFLKYEKIAVDNYRIDNSKGNYEYALCDYAYEKIYRGELEEGLAICDSIFHTALALDDHFLAINAGYNLLDGYYRSKTLEKGLKIHDYLKSRSEYVPNSYNLSLVAGLYRMAGQLDSARHYLELSRLKLHTDRDRTTFFTESQEFFLLVGDTAGALEMSDSLFAWQNAYLKNILEQPPIRAQRDYFSSESDRQGKIVIRRNIFIVALLILFFSVVVLFILYFRQRENAMNLEKEALLGDIARLNSSVDELNQDLKRSSEEREQATGEFKTRVKELEGIYYLQFSTISLLAKEYFERGQIESARNEILREIEKEIQVWRSPEKIKEIERELNLYCDNVVRRLREQCVNLSEKNITFLLYLWIGLSPKAVALFCNLKIGTVYTNRVRIIEKIQKSDAPDKEEFILRCSLRDNC